MVGKNVENLHLQIEKDEGFIEMLVIMVVFVK